MYSNSSEPSSSLKRRLGPITLIAFGVGDILGAGIYALIGKVAGVAGYATFLAFFTAFVVAAFTALSYAELTSRMPHTGGESRFVDQAFGKPLLSYLIGFLVLMSGIVSIATVSHGFAGYFGRLLPDWPEWLVIALFQAALAGITFWGIRESSTANVICTLIEVSGILLIISIALPYFGKVNYLEIGIQPAELPFVLVLQGGLIAFYAFIGFEDMVKAAEETKNPERLLPLAILVSLGIIAVLYGLTAIAAVSVVPPGELAKTGAPLMLVVERAAPWFPKEIFNGIALFAVANTALVNFVMSSRLLYGMAKQNLVPQTLGTVHPRRSTPHVAIVLILVITLLLALTGTLLRLAQSTSLLLLTVFFVVNLSLIALKLRSTQGGAVFRVPILVPILGAASTIGLALFVNKSALITVLVLALAGLLIYGGMKIKAAK